MHRKLLIVLALLISGQLYSQRWPTVMRITDSAEYKAMEPMVDSCISYLRHTLPQDDIVGRMDAVDFLNNWITGVPYLIVTQREYLIDATDRNKELMTQHVAGKMNYLNHHPEVPVDSYASELQGTLWMLDLYEHGGFERTSEMDRLLNRRNDGTLEKWLEDELPSSWIIEETQENEE